MLSRNAFELENISFSYNSRKIISRLSLTIPAGSICAVMGPNGCGKTTLLHIMLGWNKPEHGRVFAAGQELADLSPRTRGQLISLLPQTENLSFDYTVMEYILLGRAPHLHPLQQPGENDHNIASTALKQADALELKSRRIPLLSGGETQSTLMARSLTQEPEIMLLDEPANHLDPARRRHMLDIILRLKNQQKTVIFTTHDPESAAGLADYLVLMHADGSVEYGRFGKLFTEEKLSALYGIAVRIIDIGDGRVTVSY
ncbi:MAG: ABC transporter ATP-binding protein [Spirochaetales bacterium]|uniref:ABC transporter ATP-binding protein n=1 Tax=Candidatus Thalassospirochaeta sargassi TaxID=3119039 RepID=A0AAJ1IFQ6_9SPIO|nr:ABC transporter ATP-binding protein [Spirochaetales bacterium]